MRFSKGARARIWVYGGLIAGILGFYAYQPQRIDLFPKPAPKPNPPVDPNSSALFSQGAKVLIVTAHPDDTEFFLGGFLAKLKNAGATVDEVLCTDGDKSYYVWQDARANRRVRRAEQEQAAAASNVRTVTFLGFPDGRLFPNDDVVARIREQIVKDGPDYVVAFDDEYPPKVYHRDHLNSGIAAVRAAEGTNVKWLLLFATHAPNYTVDITNEWDRQKELIAIHKSQFSGVKLARIINMVESHAMEDGERIGVTYGENFRCVKGPIAPQS